MYSNWLLKVRLVPKSRNSSGINSRNSRNSWNWNSGGIGIPEFHWNSTGINSNRNSNWNSEILKTPFFFLEKRTDTKSCYGQYAPLSVEALATVVPVSSKSGNPEMEIWKSGNPPEIQIQHGNPEILGLKQIVFCVTRHFTSPLPLRRIFTSSLLLLQGPLQGVLQGPGGHHAP